MAYDIFGQPLRPGYCEVHPDVPEPYPCYVCLQEYAYHQQEQEMYRQQEPEYSMEDEMEYLRRQRKTDQKLIEEQAAQLKAAEAREARLREGLELYADEDTLARSFHEEYERACRGTGWETREECKVHFDELPANNKSAMLLTARAVGRVARSLLEVKDD